MIETEDNTRIIGDTESAFDFCFIRNVPIIDLLSQKYTQAYVNVIESYIAHRCINIHNMFSTLQKCYNIGVDKCSLNALLRILADHIAALFLIYDNSNKDEIALRHYLSIADGINSQITVMQELIAKDTISDCARNTAKETIKHEQNNLQICVNNIKALELYKSNRTSVDGLLERYNWKYKKLTNKKDHYSWPELYREKLMIQNDYLSFLSLHVHGLAGSVILKYNQETNILLIKTIATLLIMSFSKYMWMHFQVPPSNQEMDYLNRLL